MLSFKHGNRPPGFGGLIKFGSRVDLLLPPSYEVLVDVGQRLRAGETPVAMPTDPSTRPID